MAIKSTLDNGVRDIWNMVLGGLVKFGALFLHLFVLDGVSQCSRYCPGTH